MIFVSFEKFTKKWCQEVIETLTHFVDLVKMLRLVLKERGRFCLVLSQHTKET